VTITADHVDAFAERFNAVAKRQLTKDDLVSEIHVDVELDLHHANDELQHVLRHFEPFGIGNPSPVFAARNVSLAAPPRLVGRDGLKLRLATPEGELDAIGWGMSDLADSLRAGRPLDIAFRLERDEYKGENRLQAKLADIIVH
jgi:single-stranded-DNA-specific exonuclease